MTKNKNTVLGATFISIALAAASGAWAAPNDNAARRAHVVSHWTAERRAAAIPRDLVIDSRGLGYLRRADGSLVPHGHQISATDAQPTPRARPGGGPGGGGGGNNDSTPPVISNLDPNDVEIGASYTFSAEVTDTESGVKSVTFFVSDGSTDYSFAAANSNGDTWSVGLTGFTDGAWSWYVEAKDNAKKGGNTSTSGEINFIVNTGGGTGNGDTITNSEWTDGGDVQRAAGRIFFEMPSNPRRKRWVGYVCSGTVVNDGNDAEKPRSVILTAAHCVYDDANGAFARNVMFIPNQAGGGSATDRDCENDPIGCWVTSFGVVDVNWTQSVFPDNIPWDYAYYVVSDTDAHEPGLEPVSELLDVAVTPLMIDFATPPSVDDLSAGAGTPDFTYGMGYSYSDDPKFMYCAEDMTTEGTANWWLPSCGLSGGSSGGPWLQPPSAGNGPIISVNSWGYTGSPGMAGPKLHGTSAECVKNAAVGNVFPSSPSDGDAGYAVNCD